MGKHLTSEQIEQMRLYKAEGHTQEEVGKLFGVCKETARKYCKGISPMDKACQFQKRTEEEVDAIVKKYNEYLIYHSGFTKGDCMINVQCTVCGNVFQRSMVTLRHKSVIKACPFCRPESKGSAHKKLSVEEKERRKEERAKRHELTVAKMKAKSQEATKQRQEARRHNCPVCGKSTTRPKYCSTKCGRISNKKPYAYDPTVSATHEAKRRARINAQIVDKNISLKKLYDRDGGRCWICGLQCDYQDKEYRGRTMIAGNMYPSIDHVVALSDGGAHAWDNVKLAHRICNSLRYYAPHI